MQRMPDLWKVLVPVIALSAGLLLATTAHTARGTNLRSAGHTNIADLIRTAEGKVVNYSTRVNQLQRDVGAATDQLAQSDAGVAQIKNKSQPLVSPAGLLAMTGPGLSVTLDDAHKTPTDPKVNLNRLVVHQSDMQAVVNALWNGGAEAIKVMDQRLIFTSAVRCVGPTLLLNGRVFSPPYAVFAIGPADQMRAALDASPSLAQYREDAKFYGLGYKVENQSKLDVPAYDAPIGLSYAQVGP
jgi:uncharacterized protein YlxW (UPF0749 family)